MKFEDIKLSKPIQQAIAKRGYTEPTPIQAQGIPPQLHGKDILGIAQTGTGKTAAFCLPLLHKLSMEKKDIKPRHCRSLILAPTRELAAQIAKSVEEYGANTKIKYAIVYGGVGQNPQVKQMLGGVDILIATPGRLLDLKNQGHIKLNEVEVLILDEADRMLDMGFMPDIKKILKDIPTKRQTVFFSATIPPSITKLANSMLDNPVTVEIASKTLTADTVTQKLIAVPQNRKNSLLLHLLNEQHLERVLVFTRTKFKADKVARELKKEGIKADSIHGDKTQNKRTRALQAFHIGKIQVLVATDIAARGIDVNDISHVINYDLPDDADNYIHRIGRTGRAKNEGIAYSFYAPDEKKKLGAIERNIGLRLESITIPEFSVKQDHSPRSTPRGYAKKSGRERNKRGPRSDRDDNRSKFVKGKPIRRRKEEGDGNKAGNRPVRGRLRPAVKGRRPMAPGKDDTPRKTRKTTEHQRGKPRKKKEEPSEAYNNKTRKHRKTPRRQVPQQSRQKRGKNY